MTRLVNKLYMNTSKKEYKHFIQHLIPSKEFHIFRVYIYTQKKYIYIVFCCQCTDLHTDIYCAICSFPVFYLFHFKFQFQSPKKAVPPSTPDIRLPTYPVPISFFTDTKSGNLRDVSFRFAVAYTGSFKWKWGKLHEVINCKNRLHDIKLQCGTHHLLQAHYNFLLKHISLGEEVFWLLYQPLFQQPPSRPNPIWSDVT